ncbi:MAG: diguanylate cyclase [Methylobacter sp.]|nr:diguanylate cyclase [Methylobacter sp.]
MPYLLSFLLCIFLLSGTFADDPDRTALTENKPARTVQLTSKEQAWLADHKHIRIAFDGSLPPYSFINESGHLEGIAIETVNALSQMLGIKFEIYQNASWNDLYKVAVAHKVDIVATLVNRPERRLWFNFTQPYLTKSLVIMTKKDNNTINDRKDLAGKKIAIVKGYQYGDSVIEEFPSVKPYFVDTMLEALNAVNAGKADAAITFMATANYLQTKFLLNDLKFAAFYDRNSANESMAVRKDWPILAAILQKGLDALSEGEIQNVFAKWVPKSEPSVDYLLLGKILAAFLIVLVFLLLWVFQVRRQNRKINQSKNEVQIANDNLKALQSELEHLVLKRTAELNSSENKFRSLVENLRNEYFFYQHDSDGIFTYVSPSITNILGYTTEEFMTNFRTYLTDNPVNLKIDAYTEQCTKGIPNPPYELEIHDAKKAVHWLEVKDSPVYNEYGNCIGVDGIVHDITLRKQADERLIWLSYYDELTSLANRRLFADRLQQTLNMANRTKLSFSLFYLDLDHFKSVNDNLGHAAGDEILKESARRLLFTLRDSDIAARLGGDEFALILPETDAEAAVLVAEKIQKILTMPYSLKGEEITMGTSIGIAVYPKNGTDSETLVHHADDAMYFAKKEKLGFSFYSKNMQTTTKLHVHQA